VKPSQNIFLVVRNLCVVFLLTYIYMQYYKFCRIFQSVLRSPDSRYCHPAPILSRILILSTLVTRTSLLIWWSNFHFIWPIQYYYFNLRGELVCLFLFQRTWQLHRNHITVFIYLFCLNLDSVCVFSLRYKQISFRDLVLYPLFSNSKMLTTAFF